MHKQFRPLHTVPCKHVHSSALPSRAKIHKSIVVQQSSAAVEGGIEPYELQTSHKPSRQKTPASVLERIEKEKRRQELLRQRQQESVPVDVTPGWSRSGERWRQQSSQAPPEPAPQQQLRMKRRENDMAVIRLTASSPAGRSAGVISHTLRDEQVILLEFTSVLAILTGLRALALANSFLNQHQSALSFVIHPNRPYRSRIPGEASHELHASNMMVWTREMLKSDLDPRKQPGSLAYVEFALDVRKQWKQAANVSIDAAYCMADGIYYQLLAGARVKTAKAEERRHRAAQGLKQNSREGMPLAETYQDSAQQASPSASSMTEASNPSPLQPTTPPASSMTQTSSPSPLQPTTPPPSSMTQTSSPSPLQPSDPSRSSMPQASIPSPLQPTTLSPSGGADGHLSSSCQGTQQSDSGQVQQDGDGHKQPSGSTALQSGVGHVPEAAALGAPDSSGQSGVGFAPEAAAPSSSDSESLQGTLGTHSPAGLHSSPGASSSRGEGRWSPPSGSSSCDSSSGAGSGLAEAGANGSLLAGPSVRGRASTQQQYSGVLPPWSWNMQQPGMVLPRSGDAIPRDHLVGPIFMNADTSQAILVFVALKFVQKRLYHERSGASIVLTVHRNSLAPRVDGRNGFVFELFLTPNSHINRPQDSRHWRSPPKQPRCKAGVSKGMQRHPQQQNSPQWQHVHGRQGSAQGGNWTADAGGQQRRGVVYMQPKGTKPFVRQGVKARQGSNSSNRNSSNHSSSNVNSKGCDSGESSS